MHLIYLQHGTILTALTSKKKIKYKDKVTLTLYVIQLALRQIITYAYTYTNTKITTFHTAYLKLNFFFFIIFDYFSTGGRPSTGSISFRKS